MTKPPSDRDEEASKKARATQSHQHNTPPKPHTPEDEKPPTSTQKDELANWERELYYGE